MTRARYNHSVNMADAAIEGYCAKNDIALFRIEHVITWEDWDDGIGVYFFLRTNSDVEALRDSQLQSIKALYLETLRKFGYPFDEFPEVSFEIDSDENVRKKYAGSYFYRMR